MSDRTERIEQKLDVCMEILAEARADSRYLRAKLEDLERRMSVDSDDYDKLNDRLTKIEIWRATVSGIRIGAMAMATLFGSAMGSLVAWLTSR